MNAHDLPTPLHVRSGYSLLHGTQRPEALVAQAAANRCPALALTDRNNLYAATAFHTAATSAGLQPLTGAELVQGDTRVVALVRSEAGYQGLCQTITALHAPAPRPLPELLTEHAEGLHLIALDAASAGCLASAGLPPGQSWLSLEAALAAGDRGPQPLPLVATCPVLLGSPDDRDLARLLAAIRHGTSYDRIAPAALPPATACLPTDDEQRDRLRRLLADHPDAVANNRRLTADASAFRLLPRAPVFPDYTSPRGLTARRFLRELCDDGLRRRYGLRPPPGAHARLDRELALIARLGFVEYFLVVWDIVQYARRRSAPVAGRGSGASSLVAYLLEITNVCPLAYDIPFERFLHEERADFPDLDVDFCWRIRDDVIAYAFRRWGESHVAMVSMHAMFQERSAIRETLKAFGYADHQISELGEANLRGNPRLARIASLARRLTGLPHSISVHPGGIVIGRLPIDRYVPIQPAPKGVGITQYDKDGVEAIGLVKIDLLGNRNLSTVRAACRLIEQRRGEQIDIERLPTADAATIAMIQAGDTIGCNQLESPAMRGLVTMLHPRHTSDVMLAMALIRPGAASIGMKDAFIRRHRGLDPTPPGHPAVDPFLAESHGIMVYQDDVMRVAAAMLGTSLVDGDHFRRAVEKCHDDAERLALSRDFLGRCQHRGIDLDFAKHMWVQMAKYNSYSFCRAHAASYGLLSYAGVWLKAHYPLEFWCAALANNQSMYHPRVYVEAAKRMGVRFLLPDLNRSEVDFSLDGAAIRLGLGTIRGLGPTTVQTILDARRGGPFADLADFLRRTRVPHAEVRSLILAGALDSFGHNRPSLLLALNLGQRQRLPLPATRQGDLFAAASDLPGACPDYPRYRKILEEWRVLGIAVREPLMALFRRALDQLPPQDSRDLPARIGQRITLAGLLETRQTATTKGDQRMLFATFADEHGLFEVTLFPDLAQRLGHRLDLYGPYLITGRVNDHYGALTVDAETITLARNPQLTVLQESA